MPNRPSRIVIPIYAPSFDGRYWGRYPLGNKPISGADLEGDADARAAAAAALTAQIRMGGIAGAIAAGAGGLSTAIRMAAGASGRVSATASFPLTSTLTTLLNVSRVSGPAPLGVHFNAIGTTSSVGRNTVRDVGYWWDFGESGLGNWAFSGKSKNIQRGGPHAAHVFETPGTYTVRVMAYDPVTGHFSQAQVAITVHDPDVYWSTGGRQTVCLSRTTDHAGAPAGATLMSNVTAWPVPQDNTRYLLRAGQDFTTLATNIGFGSGQFHMSGLQNAAFDRYGAGADPIVNVQVWCEGGTPGDLSPGGANALSRSGLLTFAHWNGFSYFNGLGHDDVVAHKCRLMRRNGSDGFSNDQHLEFYYGWSGTPSAQRNAFRWSTGSMISECEVPDGGFNLFLFGRNVAVIGCDLHHPEQHCIRLGANYNTFIAHNRYRNAGRFELHLKYHSRGPHVYPADDAFSLAVRPRSRYGTVADNSFGAASGETNDWSVGIGPQNSEYDEVIEDVIFETNVFNYNSNDVEAWFAGPNLVSRGNTGPGYVESSTAGHRAGIPSGLDGPYFIGRPPIETIAPII